MAFTKAERAAVLIALPGLSERLRASEEAFLRLIKGGTAKQRSEAILGSRRGSLREAQTHEGHEVTLRFRYRNPAPQRDLSLERQIRNHWEEVLDAITPTRVDTGAKIRTAAEFEKAIREEA